MSLLKGIFSRNPSPKPWCYNRTLLFMHQQEGNAFRGVQAFPEPLKAQICSVVWSVDSLERTLKLRLLQNRLYPFPQRSCCSQRMEHMRFGNCFINIDIIVVLISVSQSYQQRQRSPRVQSHWSVWSFFLFDFRRPMLPSVCWRWHCCHLTWQSPTGALRLTYTSPSFGHEIFHWRNECR